jgi:hypothetical protein
MRQRAFARPLTKSGDSKSVIGRYPNAKTVRDRASLTTLFNNPRSEQETAMRQSEPPSTEPSTPSNTFLVGRDSHGHWVVQDERGLCGGLFVDRNKAIRYAMDETGKRPQAIKLVPGIFELDMSRPAQKLPQPPSFQPAPESDAVPVRRVA